MIIIFLVTETGKSESKKCMIIILLQRQDKVSMIIIFLVTETGQSESKKCLIIIFLVTDRTK